MKTIPKIESADLRVFEAAARSGSISAAAQELHTVQSNVTARIRLLENQLGVALFRRHSRGVVLTSAGEQLLPYAVKVIRLLGEAANIVSDSDTPRGTLRIGSLESTAGLRLPPILAAYRQEFPKVDLMLSTGTTGSLIEQVLSHRLEGAFVAGPVRHPDIVETQVYTEELVVVTSPRFRSLDEALRSSNELQILVLREGCSYRTRLERLLHERGVGSFRQLEFGTLEGIFGCARAGLGITLMPRSVSEQASQNGKIGMHALPKKEALVPTMFIRRRDLAMPAALSRFLECALARPSIDGATKPRSLKRKRRAKISKIA